MQAELSIALAQANFKVGDLALNSSLAAKLFTKATEQGAQLVVFSEMSITGYPAEDLVLREDFQNASMRTAKELAKLTSEDKAMLIGGLWREDKKIYNSAFLLHKGQIQQITHKYDLPNYGVFDEKRLFAPGPLPKPINFKGHKIGIMICEDMWNKQVDATLKKQGCELLISLNASPYEEGKKKARIKHAKDTVEQTGLPLIYVNQVGGQDELVFDGSSFVISNEKKITAAIGSWQQDVILLTKWHKEGKLPHCNKGKATAPKDQKYEDMYEALKLGLHDYVKKNGFKTVVIGMSGGIDSALSAVIACDALGANNVNLIMMPSRYTSEESLLDAATCSNLLSVELKNIPITKAVEAYENTLAESFSGLAPDITEENIQSRIRGTLLMAYSNKFGHMLVTTGNKSEMAVGYATIYGDMCGGFNPLKDIYKSDVFGLCKWRNQLSKAIPDNIINKPPTAELRENQKDQDTLPPYDILDDILVRLIEKRQSCKKIASCGFDINIVKRVAKLVKLAEYKRRQAAPGLKITGLAFGRDRRYPVTSGFEF